MGVCDPVGLVREFVIDPVVRDDPLQQVYHHVNTNEGVGDIGVIAGVCPLRPGVPGNVAVAVGADHADFQVNLALPAGWAHAPGAPRVAGPFGVAGAHGFLLLAGGVADRWFAHGVSFRGAYKPLGAPGDKRVIYAKGTRFPERVPGSVQRFLELLNVDGGDDHILRGAILRTGFYALDCVDDLLGGFVSDLTEDGVAAVEPGGFVGGDKEL